MEGKDQTLSPPRKQVKIIEDDKYEMRKELLKQAAVLQRLVHFEASVKPYLVKMSKEIDDLVLQFDNIDAEIKSIQKNIEKEKNANGNSATNEETQKSRESKIQEILGLEADLKRLLQEKEYYLARANNPPEDDAEYE